MKKLLIIVSALFLTLILPAIAVAQTTNNITLSATETVNHDYFAAGETVHLSGTVHGDVYAAGQTVIIDGTVDGDVIAAGKVVTISGSAHNLRIAGKAIAVHGKVLGNITAAGQTLRIDPSASISGSLVAAGSQIQILSRLGRGATLMGNETTINAPIRGDVKVAGNDLSLQHYASISGDLTTSSDLSISKDPHASISGQTITQESQAADSQVYAQKFKQAVTPILAVMKFAGFISTLLIALILILLLPQYMNQTAVILLKRPLSALGIGFLVLFLTPLVLVILFVTLIGIPLAFIVLLSYLLILAFAKTIGVFAISRRIFSKQSMHPFLAFTITLILYECILLIPVIGGLTALVIFVMGIGAIVLEKKQLLRNSKIQEPHSK